MIEGTIKEIRDVEQQAENIVQDAKRQSAKISQEAKEASLMPKDTIEDLFKIIKDDSTNKIKETK